MNTLIVTWILVANSFSSVTAPVVIAKFKDEKSCLSSVATLEKRSNNKDGMRAIICICMPAENQ